MLVPFHHPLSDPTPTCWPCIACAVLAVALIFIALATAFIDGYR